MLSKEFLIEYERKYTREKVYNYPNALFFQSDHFLDRLVNRGPDFQQMSVNEVRPLLDKIAPRLQEFNSLFELNAPYWVVGENLGYSILIKNGMPRKGKWVCYLETIMTPSSDGELVMPRNYRSLGMIYQD